MPHKHEIRVQVPVPHPFKFQEVTKRHSSHYKRVVIGSSPITASCRIAQMAEHLKTVFQFFS